MSLFGVELNHQVNRLITEIRLQLNKNKFIPNVRTIYRSIAKYDPEISGVISTNNFEKVWMETYVGFGREWTFLQEAWIPNFWKGLRKSGWKYLLVPIFAAGQESS